MKLSNTIPILRILDETKAREFYVGFLSFSIDWEHRFDDNFPLYLQASRDHCIIHLSEHHGDCNPGGAIRIETSEIDNINHELLQKHYKYAKPEVEQTSWKTREMKIIDPFGNRLIFFERIV